MHFCFSPTDNPNHSETLDCMSLLCLLLSLLHIPTHPQPNSSQSMSSWLLYPPKLNLLHMQIVHRTWTEWCYFRRYAFLSADQMLSMLMHLSTFDTHSSEQIDSVTEITTQPPLPPYNTPSLPAATKATVKGKAEIYNKHKEHK